MSQTSTTPQLNVPLLPGIRIGWLVGTDDSNRPIVDFDGNSYGPLIARTMVDVIENGENQTPASVAIAFEAEDPTLPIIVGKISDTLAEPSSVINFESQDVQAPVAKVDDRRVLLEAKEEIELRCGKSSIILRKNGKIVVRGANLLSRASQTNRIRGGSVAIN